MKGLPKSWLRQRHFLQRGLVAGFILAIAGIAGLAIGSRLVEVESHSVADLDAEGFNIDAPASREIILLDHFGEERRWREFEGQIRLVFFGYTFCPDICPMGMSNVSLALEAMDLLEIDIVPIFVSVDPHRDTPEVLGQYVGQFAENLVGLTGHKTQIAALASRFGAFYERSDDIDDPDFYLIDHTSSIYLVGRDGLLLEYYPQSIQPEALAESIASTLSEVVSHNPDITFNR